MAGGEDEGPEDLDRVESALDCFRQGHNCAQAILVTFGPRYGLPPEMALRLAAPFGGGMGGLGEVCGAVSAGLMVLGLAKGFTRAEDREAKEEMYRLAREFVGLFEERNGSALCRKLIGCDIHTPEGVEEARGKGVFRSLCPRFVRDAAEILSRLA